MARKYLESHGYQVLRSIGENTPVDLVAWEDTGYLLLVLVRRTRHPLEGSDIIITTFYEDIATLRSLARPSHATLQFWLWTDYRGFRVFEVLPGGIREVSAFE